MSVDIDMIQIEEDMRHLPKRELSLIKSDPWREMAIEKQFQPLVEEEYQEYDFPSTLAYLNQEMHKYEDPEGTLYDAQRYLLEMLDRDLYALALLNILWIGLEDGVMLSDVMDETLSSPGVLISELSAAQGTLTYFASTY